MSKSQYQILIIREGRENDYQDWENGASVNSDGEELHSDLVSFTAFIEARNLKEAIEIARKKYPRNSIAIENSGKIG